MQIPNFHVGFGILAPFCCNVTMKSTEAFGHWLPSADELRDQDVVLLNWILNTPIQLDLEYPIQ